jgi:mRNA-degrading endonuclease YafQ of YafQ-DinJ toxin-antitoxin module
MQVLQTRSFQKTVKKLHANQKKALDEAVRILIKNPAIGDMKTGDLDGIQVYKFKMVNQLTLLAYTYEDSSITLTLLALGTHENFYRDLKKQGD